MKDIDQTKIIKVSNTRYRESFHIQTNGGWLNDPNGLCYYKGYYHVFYQFHPYSSQWGPMHWGHVCSKDLVHWEQLPVALVPGDAEDTGGCFSGSAIVKDNRLFLIYTGHHYYDDGDQDHFWENQNIAYSDDGINFTKYDGNPVIEAPEDNSQDFRDPKVWEFDGQYYLVLGSRSKDDNRGRILLYQSADLLHWNYRGVIAKSTGEDTEGFMWECPDFFRINGRDIIACSPMGIKASGHNYLNLSQNGVFIGQLSYQTATFEHGGFNELDSGHNFYAAQSFLTPDGRQIQFGWFSSFDQPMPEQADGWAGALTLPRELVLKDNQLGAIPAKEVKLLRNEQLLNSAQLINGDQSLAIADPQHTEWHVVVPVTNENDEFTWQLSDGRHNLISLTYNKASGELTVHQHGQDTNRYAQIGQVDQLDLRIFVDTSSAEFFINNGAATFSERYYTTEKVTPHLVSNHSLPVNITVYSLKG
ncbi:glycoside hydrolase family 32 protein [Lactobacillus sp. Marseille-P7033]|nr:glycoside hydrolase family 32 protein [Lactobacillus sp. Marseille-P7033]